MNHWKKINFSLRSFETGNLSADNFKKILDHDGSTLESAVWSADTGQRMPYFDSCQLITTLMCNSEFSLGLLNQLESVKVNIGSLWCGRTVGGRSVYGHVITKFSGMGRFTQLWGAARGAPLLGRVLLNEKMKRSFTSQVVEKISI